MTVPTLDLAPAGPGISRLASWGLPGGRVLDPVHGSLDPGIITFDHAGIPGDAHGQWCAPWAAPASREVP